MELSASRQYHARGKDTPASVRNRRMEAHLGCVEERVQIVQASDIDFDFYPSHGVDRHELVCDLPTFVGDELAALGPKLSRVATLAIAAKDDARGFAENLALVNVP
jgi:hypothetical protein